MSLWMSGGIVLWMLILLIVAAILVFIDRMLRLRKILIDPQDFFQGVCNVLDKHKTDEALAICDETPGPLSALVAIAITHRNSDEKNLREMLAATAHAELSRIEGRSMLLSLFAQLLPLLGLIGTFIGGYAALMAIDSQAPLVETGAVVEALAGALVTTIVGLIGAAGCYAAHHLLVLKINVLSLDMDIGVSLLLDYLARTPTVNLPEEEKEHTHADE